MDNTLSQNSDVFSFLNELKSYLRTEYEVGESTINEYKRSHVPLTIKISNTAPNEIEKPLIVFIGVKLLLTGSRDIDPMWAHTGGTLKHFEMEYRPVENPWFSNVGKSIGNFSEFPKITEDEKQHGNVLFPGESLIYKFMVPLDAMAEIGFNVDGTVSRRHLFYLKNKITLPEAYTKPPAVAVMQAFNKVELHKPLDAVLTNLPDLTKAIKTNEMSKEFVVAVITGPAEVKNVQALINSEFGSGRYPPLSWFRVHVKKAFSYLDHVYKSLNNLKLSMEANSPSGFTVAAEELKNIRSEAAQLNKETEEIMRKYNISDEEVGYRYRGCY
jgi:hypothetical protein